MYHKWLYVVLLLFLTTTVLYIGNGHNNNNNRPPTPNTAEEDVACLTEQFERLFFDYNQLVQLIQDYQYHEKQNNAELSLCIHPDEIQEKEQVRLSNIPQTTI